MSAAGQETFLSFNRPKTFLITKLNSHHQNESYQELIILPLKDFTQQILSLFSAKIGTEYIFQTCECFHTECEYHAVKK